MRRALLAVLLVLPLVGCGDPDLWARWRADRAMFHANRLAEAALARGAPATARGRAESELRAVERAFPASRWGTPPASGPARDVALTASRAAMLLARIAESAGDDETALERWREARERWGALEGVRVASHAGAARVLERLGRDDEVLQEQLALAGFDPLGDPDRPDPSPAVLAAPTEAAEGLRAEGRAAEAESVLVAAERRLGAALGRVPRASALPVATALASVREALGDTGGALAALRATLDGLRAWQVPGRMLDIARFAFEAGASDSAIAYTRWICGVTNRRDVVAPALLLAGRAWEKLGRADSAFAAYDGLFVRWADPGPFEPEARFRRAVLLAHDGQWERARADFAALAAAAPADPFAFQAPLEVVRHYLDRHEFDLARLEASNALQRIAYLASTNRDPAVQRLAGLARGQLFLDLGYNARAESCLVDLWRRFPEDSATESGALRGAALAEHRPGGGPAAAAIYDSLARHAAFAPVRREAARRLAALDAAGQAPEGANRP